MALLKRLTESEIKELREKELSRKRKLNLERRKFIEQKTAANPRVLAVLTLAGEIFDLQQRVKSLEELVSEMKNNSPNMIY